jgi:hypothetical protein
VNDAGAFIYGSLEDTPLEDQRRLIDVTYWGTVHGSLAAMRHMKESGGAVVNVGSVLGERAIALQGPYCAAKFAVKAFTDTLRMEIAMSGYPISVTLIKPGPIDTPYMEHARNLIGSPGTRNPPPAYHPRVVARAILHACAHPVRDLTVGGGGLGFAVMGKLFPALTDAAMVALARPTQTSDDPGRSSAATTCTSRRKTWPKPPRSAGCRRGGLADARGAAQPDGRRRRLGGRGSAGDDAAAARAPAADDAAIRSDPGPPAATVE